MIKDLRNRRRRSEKQSAVAGFQDGDVTSLQQLREMAWQCCCLQFIAALFYLLTEIFYSRSNGMAIACGIVAIFVSLYPVLYAVIKRKFSLVFSCITAFNLAPIWFLYLEAVLPGYDAYVYSSPADRVNALFWIAVFQLFFNLFYVIFWKNISRFSIGSFSFLNQTSLKPKFFIWLTFLVFIIPLVAFYFYYGSAAILWTAVTAGRTGGGSSGGLLIAESIGGSSSLLMPLNWLWQLTPVFSCIAFASVKKKYSLIPLLSLVPGLLVIFSFFLSGSRGSMMFVAAPVIFFLIFYNWQRGMKFWLPFVVSLFFLIGVMELQQRFRGNLLDVIANPEKAVRQSDFKSVTSFDPTQSHRDNNMYLLCLIVKGYPKKYAYEGFHDFLATVANPIPRALWPGKPVFVGAQDLIYQPGFVLDGPLYIGTTSLSYSIVGEAYKANGLAGILLYTAVYALILIFFDGIIYYTKEKQVLAVGLLGMSIFLAFWGGRAFFALMTFSYPLLLLLLFVYIVKLVRRF